MKLTKRQKSLLSRDLILDHGEPFVILHNWNDDNIAKNLSVAGLGQFFDNGAQYTWRKRDGYTNNFYPNEQGLEIMKELKE